MKILKLLFFFSVFTFSFSLSFGQVRFTSIPKDSELIARDLHTNLGTFHIQGTVDTTNTPYDSIGIRIYRNSIPVDSLHQKLVYSHGIAAFNFTFQIPAELDEYTLSVYGLKNVLQVPDTTINALLAGDVFVIDGQSNAFAQQRDAQNADTNKSEFIRVFGNADSSTAGLMANLKWFRAEGNGSFTENGHAGQWGLRLGRLIVDSIKIPVAIFNGACGGTPISYFERPANYKTDSNSNYGRLYYRLTHTGLRNNVRAIIWSQGESDGYYGTSTATYINEFDTLKHSFMQDFPGYKKTYIFQTKTENIFPVNNIMAIEEAQRQLAIVHDTDMEIMPTAALKQDNGGLHFDYTGGYREFADRIFELIKRDIYGISTTREIDAPMVTAAYLIDTTKLVIIENADSLLEHNPALSLQTSSIKSYQIENALAGTLIDTIFPEKNKIILKLSQYPGTGFTVSYFAPIYDTGSNWLTNTNGLEPVCFYRYPVADSTAPITAAIANYYSPALPVYPNPFNSYTNVSVPKSGKYMLELSDIMGKRIQSITFTGTQYQLSAQGLAKGMYFIRAYDDNMDLIGVCKIVVQ